MAAIQPSPHYLFTSANKGQPAVKALNPCAAP